MTRCLLLVLLLADSARLAADTVYVRDTLYVPLRGGQSTEHRILHRGLQSGLQLERLEINEDTGYSRVRTEGGLEGWLQSQYLVTEPIAQQRLEAISAELSSLQAEHQQTLLRLRDLREANETMSSEISTLNDSRQELSKQLEDITNLAANTISVDEENARLKGNERTLTDKLNHLTVTNQDLQNKESQQWFMYGAATIMLGLLLGLWVGRRIYHRRHRGGWG